jgi:hypothetical protein
MAGLSFYRRRLAWSALHVSIALTLAACTHAERSDFGNNTCDAAKAQALQKNGYELLNQGKWYEAHLVGHALMSIGSSCNRADVAAPAMVHGVYMRAVVAKQTHNSSQARQFVTYGLSILAQLKAHESSNAMYGTLYDQMQPRFLELQMQLH